MTLYPDGYGTEMITLERMRELHEPRMHPEFARRFFRYIESKGGQLGVGGGFRKTQPVKPGFAPPGQSFHEAQTFASGIVGYCAVDLVVPVPGKVHRSPTWAECADAPGFLLHTFVTNEPWHIQPLEIRGWQTWVNAGRPDPKPPITTPTPPDPNTGEDMLVNLIRLDGTNAVYAQYSGGYKVWIRTEAVLNMYTWISGKTVTVIPASARPLFEAAGPILGPVPPGTDPFGLPL